MQVASDCGTAVLSQSAQRSEVNVEILVRESEDRLQLVHPVVQLEQGESKALDLLIRQRATIHAADRLVLQNLTQQFYHGQHESRKALLDSFRIGVDAFRQRAGNGVERGRA